MGIRRMCALRHLAARLVGVSPFLLERRPEELMKDLRPNGRLSSALF